VPQVAGQVAVVPLHRYGAQLGEPPPLTLVQVPLALAPSAAEQASHEPLHEVLQQNPSTQLPLVHWLAAVQALPSPSLAVHLLAPSQ